jgi:hypothetical protein
MPNGSGPEGALNRELHCIMLKRITLSIAALLVTACALPALAADPSPAQVYQAARSGNLAEAQQMIAQVLRDHPQSGEAHYVAAEIDARAGNSGLARQELQTAQSLKPGLPFADPRAVRELQQQLGEATVATSSQQAPVRIMGRSSHFGLFLILIGAAIVLWLVLRRRAAAMGYQYPGAYPGNVPPGVPPGGYSPGGYPGGYMPGGGSGIMGSVASGLALGAGVAAGEGLVQHMMGGGSSAGGGFVPPAQAGEMPPDPNTDMGGNDFGLNDAGSWDDGSGGGGGGGWDDGGGGGDGGGGWS